MFIFRAVIVLLKYETSFPRLQRNKCKNIKVKNITEPNIDVLEPLTPYNKIM